MNTNRSQIIEGLREMADFLDANPGLPVTSAHASRWFYAAGEGPKFLAAAEALGEQITPAEIGDLKASRVFAGGVSYTVRIPERLVVERKVEQTVLPDGRVQKIERSILPVLMAVPA